MGTPLFAAEILKYLVEKSFNIVGVVTVPDKPAGRGQKLHQSEVKKVAEANGLNLLQPEKLKDDGFVQSLKELNADVFVVIAFRMLPKVVWEIPSLGTFNLHGSLLPQYRGAAPINWAIINGEKLTGVTTFFINEEIDTGDIILRREMVIGENETAGELHDKMIKEAAIAVEDTLKRIFQGEISLQPQSALSSTKLNDAPKLSKEIAKISYNKDIYALHNFIRGLSPFPGAWTKIKNIETEEVKTLKIYQTQVYNTTNNDQVSLEKFEKNLLLTTKQGTIEILNLQLEGKKRLTAQQFMAGFNFDQWQVFID